METAKSLARLIKELRLIIIVNVKIKAQALTKYR